MTDPKAYRQETGRPATPDSLSYAILRVLREDFGAFASVTTNDVANAVAEDFHVRFGDVVKDAANRKPVRNALYRFESMPSPSAPVLSRVDDGAAKPGSSTAWLILPYVEAPVLDFEIEGGLYAPCPSCRMTPPHCACTEAEIASMTTDLEWYRAWMSTKRRSKTNFPK